MKLYVVRHGETNMGANQQIATIDEPLNEKGKKQAIDLGEKLKEIEFDLIYVSPVKRVKDTLKFMRMKKDIPVMIEERLKEREMGIYEGSFFYELDWKKFWSIESDKKYKNLEPMKDVYQRVSLFLDEVKKLNKKNILIVTHGGIEMAINWYFYGFDEPLLKCENAKVYEYELE